MDVLAWIYVVIGAIISLWYLAEEGDKNNIIENSLIMVACIIFWLPILGLAIFTIDD